MLQNNMIIRENAERLRRSSPVLSLSEALYLVMKSMEFECSIRQFCRDFGDEQKPYLEEAFETGLPVTSPEFSFYARGYKDRLYACGNDVPGVYVILKEWE